MAVADYIKEYRSLMVNMKGTDEYRQCGLALRASGGIDFYFDFRLVETSECKDVPSDKDNPVMKYTAIDMDFNYLHFKRYEEKRKDVRGVKSHKPVPIVTYYRCRTSWRQRIGLFSSTVAREETLDQVRARLSEAMKP